MIHSNFWFFQIKCRRYAELYLPHFEIGLIENIYLAQINPPLQLLILRKSVNCYSFCCLVQADERTPENPCINNPCGPHSQCRVIGNQGACSCLPNYMGRPPNCRPECVIDSECPSNKACKNERCIDPCVGTCGVNALCNVVKHNPVCICISGYDGDPYTQCTIKPVTRKTLILLHCLLIHFVFK